MTGGAGQRAGRRWRRGAAGALAVGAIAAFPQLVDPAAAPDGADARKLSLAAPTQAAGTAEDEHVEAAGPPSPSQPRAGGTTDPEVVSLRRDLEQLLADTGWRSARLSVLAVSIDRGDTLFAHNADEPLAPASNIKVITTAAALHHLGPAFRYHTWLLADGPVVDGVLEGDLVLYGTGDPTFSDRFHRTEATPLDALAETLADAGIRAIAGDLVGDATYFSGPGVLASWDLDDLNEWYAAPVSALSYNENMISLRIQAAGWVGAPPRIDTRPHGAGVLVRNEALTIALPPGTYRRIAVVRHSPAEPIRVLGEMHLNSPDVWREVTVSNPALYAATMLAVALGARGIEVYGRTRTVERAEESPLGNEPIWGPAFGDRPVPRVLAEAVSPPLTELLEVVNNESHNLYAESLLRSLGSVVSGDASFVGGARVSRRFLTDLVGVPPDRIQVVDGSGLSAANRVSARAFVQLLDHMARSEHWEAFWEALPEAGNRRELPRMYRTAAAGNLRAKTGTIDRVSALSGVVRSSTGERIAFSVLANDVRSRAAAKRVEDRIGIRLATFRRPSTPAEPDAPQ